MSFGFYLEKRKYLSAQGNHEYLFERYLQGIVTAEIWDACGGTATRQEVDRLSADKESGYPDVFERTSYISEYHY
ncbi:MAG: hypothetical protein ACLTS6_08965 [Anaerobutyricum sp.]